MVNQIDSNSIVPMYKQLLDIIKNDIYTGNLKSGNKLPSEASLMNTYNVSRVTVRAAISELVEEGILVRSQGKGTFVATPKKLYSADDRIGFSRSCILAGKNPSTKLLSSSMSYPNKNDMEFFGINEDSRILVTERLRMVDDEPILLETNHYPASFSFLLEEDLNGSLFELLENKYNIVPSRSIRTLDVCFPTQDEMRILNVHKGTPLLLFKDLHYDNTDEPIFSSKQVYCSDRLKFYL